MIIFLSRRMWRRNLVSKFMACLKLPRKCLISPWSPSFSILSMKQKPKTLKNSKIWPCLYRSFSRKFVTLAFLSSLIPKVYTGSWPSSLITTSWKLLETKNQFNCSFTNVSVTSLNGKILSIWRMNSQRNRFMLLCPNSYNAWICWFKLKIHSPKVQIYLQMQLT